MARPLLPPAVPPCYCSIFASVTTTTTATAPPTMMTRSRRASRIRWQCVYGPKKNYKRHGPSEDQSKQPPLEVGEARLVAGVRLGLEGGHGGADAQRNKQEEHVDAEERGRPEAVPLQPALEAACVQARQGGDQPAPRVHA